MIGKKTIQQLSENLEENLKKELRDQGHYLTGALERSIRSDIRQDSRDTTLDVTANDYIQDLEEGIPPEHISADTAYVMEMAEYARKRFGLQGKAALRAGYAIARKHKQEGMPTKNSYNFSSTGERTAAIEESYFRNRHENEQLVSDGLSVEMDDLIDKTFDVTIF